MDRNKNKKKFHTKLFRHPDNLLEYSLDFGNNLVPIVDVYTTVNTDRKDMR